MVVSLSSLSSVVLVCAPILPAIRVLPRFLFAAEFLRAAVVGGNPLGHAFAIGRGRGGALCSRARHTATVNV